ncbi:MAG: helix-turn-helix transcriptional regulator [Bacteroidota bacterium]
MHVGERIKELRTKAGLTQSDLAKLVEMTYIQIGRYETKKANPSPDVLQKITQALNTTTDYLMNGSADEMASSQLQDKELLNLFKSIEQLGNDDKKMIKTFLDALVTKRKIQAMA